MSLLSSLSRGTGTVDGDVVGDGFETITEYSVNKRVSEKRQKSSKARVPSTYLTRRGNLILYTRADKPPTWETQILDHYKDMGSLVSQMEDVVLKKEEMRKEMDRRCTPGRAFNPYLGLLKNTLLCSSTVKAITNVMELGVSSGGRSFTRQGSSPGVDLIPSHLEEMGVNIAEFLQGKGSLNHLVPQDQVPDILVEFTNKEQSFSRAASQTSENVRAESTLPTPAPPQSPLPDEANHDRDLGRTRSLSAGTTRRRGSARTPLSARSYGQFSDVDSAYGTNKLPPIHNPVRLSTIQSESSHLLDIHATRPTEEKTENSAMPSIFTGNAGFSRPERSYWMPEVSEATFSMSVEDVDQGQEEAFVSEAEDVPEIANQEKKNSLQPSQLRTAAWINQTSESPTSPIPSSNREEELSARTVPISVPSLLASDRVSTLDHTADESVSELQRLKEENVTPVTTETSRDNGTFTITEDRAARSTPVEHADDLIESADVEESVQRTGDMSDLSAKYRDSQELMTIQSFKVADEDKSPSSRTTKARESERLSHPTSAVSSVSEGVVKDFPDRNASNAFGLSWTVEDRGSVMGKESGFSGDSVNSEDISKVDVKSLPQEEISQDNQQIKKSPRSGKGASASYLSDSTSGVETNASAMTFHVDHSALENSKTDISPLLEAASPIGDRIGTPVLQVTSPSPRLQPERAPSIESLTPRPPSAPRPKSSNVASSPKRQIRAKPTKTPRKPKARTTKPRQKTATNLFLPYLHCRANHAKLVVRNSAHSRPPEPVVIAEVDEEEQARIDAEKAALAAAAAAEKERRLAQAANLQNRILAAEEARALAEKEAERRRQETEAELKALAAEEETMRLMEEEARQQMRMSRKEAREAREKRRQDDLERKKEEIRRRKEEDIRRQEAANRREREMLDRLGDPSLRQRIADDDAVRRAQQEKELEERLQEEEESARERAAAEEERMEEFERLAEEEAMLRLREDMEDVEERRRDLNYRREMLDKEQEERRLAALAEERKMEEAKRLQEELARKKEYEAEQARIKLALEEESLRLKLEKDADERQMELVKRREHNLELRTDLQNLHHRQQITRPWVFSYFVHWPRETFERPIGGDIAKPKRFRFPPKSAPNTSNSLPPL